MLWLVFIFLTCVAVLAVLLPLAIPITEQASPSPDFSSLSKSAFAFPAAKFDHSSDHVFGLTFVNLPRGKGVPIAFALSTKTKRVREVAVPVVSVCDREEFGFPTFLPDNQAIRARNGLVKAKRPGQFIRGPERLVDP